MKMKKTFAAFITVTVFGGMLSAGEINIHKRGQQAFVSNQDQSSTQSNLVWNVVEKNNLTIDQKPGFPWTRLLAFRIKATAVSNVQNPKVVLHLMTQPAGSCYYKILEFNGNGTTTFNIPLSAMNKSKNPQKIQRLALRTNCFGLTAPEEFKITFEDFTIITEDETGSPGSTEASAGSFPAEPAPSTASGDSGINLLVRPNAVVAGAQNGKLVWKAGTQANLMIYPPQGKKFNNIKTLRLKFTPESSAARAKFVVQLLSLAPDKEHYAYVNFACNAPFIYDIPVEKMQYMKGHPAGSGEIDYIALRCNKDWCGTVPEDLVIKFDGIELIPASL